MLIRSSILLLLAVASVSASGSFLKNSPEWTKESLELQVKQDIVKLINQFSQGSQSIKI